MKTLNIIKYKLLKRQLADAMFKTSLYQEYKKFWDKYTYYCISSPRIKPLFIKGFNTFDTI